MTTSADILAHRAKQLAPCIADIAKERSKRAKRRAYLGVSLACIYENCLELVVVDR